MSEKEKEEVSLFALTAKERDIVIAALRHWQETDGNGLSEELWDIAINGRSSEDYLNDPEIDVLIEEKLNTEGLTIRYVSADGDGGDMGLLTVSSSRAEAIEHWHRYYELSGPEADLAISNVFRLELSGEPGSVWWVTHPNGLPLNAGVARIDE